jgi:hypothetical protein
MGGRPRKPTSDEAREAALERLMPKTLRVLEEKLDANDTDSWRAGVKLIEYGWGRPAEQVDVRTEPQVESYRSISSEPCRPGPWSSTQNMLGSPWSSSPPWRRPEALRLLSTCEPGLLSTAGKVAGGSLPNRPLGSRPRWTCVTLECDEGELACGGLRHLVAPPVGFT